MYAVGGLLGMRGMVYVVSIAVWRRPRQHGHLPLSRDALFGFIACEERRPLNYLTFYLRQGNFSEEEISRLNERISNVVLGTLM